tara:strand:- start:1015 stop:1491 length:477 start_codon:yes stop_codon:yes gene_type:complete
MQTGHIFRSEVLQQCALVEKWTVSILESPNVLALRNGKTLLPRLFGQKLRAVSELSKANPELFRKSERIDVLLDEFQPYADMRSELAHSILSCGQLCEEPLMVYTNTGMHIAPDTPKRITLKESECKSLLSKLKQQVKQIQDQKLKLPATVTPVKAGA